jgi:hypothetical protein
MQAITLGWACSLVGTGKKYTETSGGEIFAKQISGRPQGRLEDMMTNISSNICTSLPAFLIVPVMILVIKIDLREIRYEDGR